MDGGGELRGEEAELLSGLLRGDRAAAAFVIQRHNRSLFRIARGILEDESEAEEAVQETYLRAFASLPDFRGEASLSTWLSRIVINEALRRRARRRPTLELSEVQEDLPADHPGSITMPPPASPENAAARAEIRGLVERAIDTLPPPFRIVFVMRVVEQLSIEETAAMLGVPEATVKTRLHRANRHLRDMLGAEFAAIFADTFPFAGARCERLTMRVLARFGSAPGPPA